MQQIKSFIFIFMVVATVFIAACDDSSADNKYLNPKICSETVMVKIGGKTFEILRQSGSTIINSSKKLPCDGFVETDNLIYRPYKFMGHDDSEDRQFIVSISVFYERSEKKYDIKDTYMASNVLQMLDDRNIDLHALPIEHGFYKFEHKPNQFLFIATDENLKTSAGNPLTFGCVPLFSDTKNFTCGANQVWEHSYRVGIGSFTTVTFPIAQWKELHTYFLEYLKDLEISSTEKGE